jgi:hypothetical protein
MAVVSDKTLCETQQESHLDLRRSSSRSVAPSGSANRRRRRPLVRDHGCHVRFQPEGQRWRSVASIGDTTSLQRQGSQMRCLPGLLISLIWDAADCCRHSSGGYPPPPPMESESPPMRSMAPWNGTTPKFFVLAQPPLKSLSTVARSDRWAPLRTIQGQQRSINLSR